MIIPNLAGAALKRGPFSFWEYAHREIMTEAIETTSEQKIGCASLACCLK